MDFGPGGNKILMCGRAPIDNIIHIRFGNDVENNQIIEFKQSDDYQEKEFDLKPVTGIQKYLLSLPGSILTLVGFKP